MSHKAWINHTVRVPGTSVTACLGQFAADPSRWVYTLWADGDMLDCDSCSLSTEGLVVTPEQVARIAFLLEVEYVS